MKHVRLLVALSIATPAFAAELPLTAAACTLPVRILSAPLAEIPAVTSEIQTMSGSTVGPTDLVTNRTFTMRSPEVPQ